MVPSAKIKRINPALLSKLARQYPEIPKRVERSFAQTAMEVQTGSKRKAPVDTGRLKLSIATVRTEDTDGAKVWFIGTNVVAPLPKGKRMRKRYHAKSAKWKFGSARGYVYPARQEFDDKLSHTTGQAHYFRDSTSAAMRSNRRRIARLIQVFRKPKA